MSMFSSSTMKSLTIMKQFCEHMNINCVKYVCGKNVFHNFLVSQNESKFEILLKLRLMNFSFNKLKNYEKEKSNEGV